MMKNLFDFFKKDNIGEPPWDYDFLLYLPESEYPKYLRKIFKYRTEEELPLNKNGEINKNKLKTFNQKIQWLKLYGVTSLVRNCTDKIKVRDYVKEKIGEEYLKPVLQVCNNFEEINFDNLPDTFVMKCSHANGWKYVIKDKKDYLAAKPLVDITKKRLNDWLDHEFWCFSAFELNYKGLVPKIVVEPLLRDEKNVPSREIEIYCFNGKPKIFVNVRSTQRREVTFYDEYYNVSDLVLMPDDPGLVTANENADDLIKQAVSLSSELSQDFVFVKADYLVFKNKLYFNGFTFMPYSGLVNFDKSRNEKMGSWIDLNNV